MLSFRTALAAAVALALLLPAASASGQGNPPPRKRIDVVTQGMTPAQVRAVLGEPLRTRQDGALSYMYYPNGCQGCTEDYVVVRDCRVVAARFQNPGRFIVRHEDADPVPPPTAECRLSAAGDEVAPLPQVVAAAPPPPPPPAPPADTVRRDTCGPLPYPRQIVPDAPVQRLDARAWRDELTEHRPATHLVAVPAASISSPTAFGSQMGEAFVAVAYQQRTRFTDIDDAAAVLGLGLGDRDRYVALEVAFTSYSTLRGGGPLETGGVSFKLHRALGDRWGVAVGMENAIDWGGNDGGKSPFAVATRVLRLQPDATDWFSALALSLGVGAGRFRSEDDVVDDRETVNVFGSAGLQVTEPVSVVADWTGQDLFAGVSVAPVRRVPLVVTAGFADITRNAGDGPRFVLSAALGFRYLRPFFF